MAGYGAAALLRHSGSVCIQFVPLLMSTPPRPGDRELPMGQPPKQERVASQSLKAVLGVRDLVFFRVKSPPASGCPRSISASGWASRAPRCAPPWRGSNRRAFSTRFPRAAIRCAPLPSPTWADAIELRGVLEGTAARLAAERGVPPNRLAQLRAIVAELDPIVAVPVEELDFIAYEDLNARFHQMLAELCGSRIIQRQIEHATQLPFAGPSAFLNAQTDIPAFSGIAGDRPGPSPRAGPRHRDAGGFACRVARARACAAGAPEPRFRHEGQLAHRARFRASSSSPPEPAAGPKTHAVERPGGCQPSRALCNLRAKIALPR